MMKYLMLITLLALSACATVSEERMEQKYAEDRYRHEVYLEQEFLADCIEYEMEECYE